MTTTSVKDVGSVMNLGVAAGNQTGKVDKGSFQNVLDTQTGKGKAEEQPGARETTKQPEKTEGAVKPGKQLKSTDRGNVRADGADQAEPDTAAIENAPGEMPEEDFEQAMEVLVTAVTGLVQQIADTFEMPVEEVQGLMTDLNMQPVDLIKPENMSDLLLEAGGAQDSLALLTDEKLYTDFQSLMDQGKAVVEQTAEELQVSPEQLEQIVEQAVGSQTEKAPVKDIPEAVSEPVIEVTVQTAEAEPEVGPEERVSEDEEPAIPQTTVQDNGAIQTPETKEQETAESGDPEDRSQNGRERSEHSVRTESNPMFQNIRGDNFEPQMENVQETPSVWNTDTQNLMRQILDYMRIQVRPDVSNLEMQLHPASLGTLQVQVASRGGVLTANFVTQNEAVKAALESQMIQLKESFAEQGVKVEAIEVTVQTHQFEENLEQGRGRQPQGSGERRNRTRRIHLDDVNGAGGLAEPTEADRLAAEMLAAGGNTVDYTA